MNILVADDFAAVHLLDYDLLGSASFIGRNVETIAKHKDRGTFPIEICITISYHSGKRFFTFVVRDITERKKAEERINQYTDRVDGLISKHKKPEAKQPGLINTKACSLPI